MFYDKSEINDMFANLFFTKNQNYRYYLLTCSYKKIHPDNASADIEKQDLHYLSRLWHEHIEKKIPDSSASYKINNGNIFLIIKSDEEKFFFDNMTFCIENSHSQGAFLAETTIHSLDIQEASILLM